MNQPEDIIEFISQEAGINKKRINISSDLDSDLGITGEDFHELIERFSKKFHVDMSTYLWYFHTEEEGQNFGALFFKPPDQRVKRIAVTPQILLDSANKGKWIITYPDHEIPGKRKDLLLNKILIFVFLLCIAIYYLFKWYSS